MLFPHYCPLFIGLQVFPIASGSSRVNIYDEGSSGLDPLAAFPPVPQCSATRLQLRPLQRDLPALRHALLQFRKAGRPL